ncbi:MFS general substrate transporter [Teratosphaeria nubilosa]|uniref:MFS general substrate transporter n=1 Tax=Teratosphaeria nubilosa TaxID=161662 RepID=A0A6G1LD61_9PEZI|nr:MFS general substrate transporter [Teratosphaeria nubilosa]
MGKFGRESGARIASEAAVTTGRGASADSIGRNSICGEETAGRTKSTAPGETTVQSLEGVQDVNQSTARARKPLSFHLAFVGLCLLLLVFQMDATGLSIALPTIAGDLTGTSVKAFWANCSYTLCGLAVQPIWASVSDAFGRKYPLYLAVAFFSVGSIVFALAHGMGIIIAGRVLQGFGGAGVDALVTIIIADMTTLDERSWYLGLLNAVTAAGIVMGPFICALLATYSSWRWIGWINLPPLGVGSLLVIFRLRLKPVPLDAAIITILQRLDWAGMILIAGGVTTFCVAISCAGSLYPWGSWRTLLPLLLGIFILIAFAWYESKPAAPVIPLRLFHTKTGNMALLGGFLHGAILMPGLQYLPMVYQAVLLKTATSTALYLLPTLVLSVLVTAVSMMIVPVLGGYVWLLRGGWTITALGTGLLVLYHTQSSTAIMYGLPVLWAQGVSMLRVLMLPAQASVKHVNDEGLATANFMTIRMFGGLIGLAICAPIFNNVFATSIGDAAVEPTGPLAPLENASNAVNFIDSLRSLDVPEEAVNQVSQLYLDSFSAIFYTMTALSGLGLFSSIFLDEISLNRRERGRQHIQDE